MSKLLFTPTKPCGWPLEGIIYPSIKSGTIINPPYFLLKDNTLYGRGKRSIKEIKNTKSIYIERERERGILRSS
jgi:hypothetical protein